MSDAAVGGLIGAAGTLLLYLVQRWLTAPDRRAQGLTQAAEQKQAIADANNDLGASLRAELRTYNQELQGRLTAAELKQAATDAKLEVVQRENETLRHENFTLKGENGELKARVVALTERVERQAETIAVLSAQAANSESDRLVLMDAMRARDIDIPPLAADKKPGTGPLAHK